MHITYDDRSPIVLAGGGGHCHAVIDVLESADIPIAGVVHGPDCALTPVLGYPPLGHDADLPGLRKKFSQALVTVGQIKTPRIRQTIFAKLRQLEFELPVIISPLAHVSRYSTIGEGSVVMHMAIVNAGTFIGNNCIINSKGLIEHDCNIADHCHIAVGAILCGKVTVNEGTFIGAGVVIKQKIHIGKRVIIGCGTTICDDVPDGTIVKGQHYG
ncbi:acetyltransferase [Desulfovibrio legallii]|uniref:Sugar O-acyltransferase, sialic acid O-acetyltransferase NeuD family n=1 Tax=Desulfovibrio legallii TaxID=571438 RepID=A0A1G7J7Y3_9BACT|nr:acetyltransferase [Desulfovibrio legallii]SDF21097.1 sugar O-acyltransferase, sialic acid O-acetyltransferase NeuD family [Desulfovibrio legallii]